MSEKQLEKARDTFISQWGVLGMAWGVNRTIAQIHALLLVSIEPLTTDEIMKQLMISRGNAHTNIKELVNWGIVRVIIKKGDRKEYFVAEKDVWKIFCTISMVRKKKEIEPALQVLEQCIDETRDLKGEDAKEFNQQLKALSEFTALADGVMNRIGNSEKSLVMKWLMKMMG